MRALLMDIGGAYVVLLPKQRNMSPDHRLYWVYGSPNPAEIGQGMVGQDRWRLAPLRILFYVSVKVIYNYSDIYRLKVRSSCTP